MPLSLYAHSMGGAVGAHFLLRHPQLLHKAVLSSPMIAPSSGAIPLWVGHAMTKTMVMLGQGKKRAFIGGPYDPDKETFEASCTTSPARFAYYTDKRKATPCLQVCAPSYQWVLEAIVQTKSLMRKPACQAVRTPVLLCQAKLDDVVRLPEQNQFIQLLPHGELVCFDKAKHEIFNSPDEVMKPYVQKVLTFLLSE